MNTEWNLEVLYKGLDDPNFAADFKALEECGKEMKEYVLVASKDDAKTRTEKLLVMFEQFNELINKLGLYLSLRNSVNTEDGEIMAWQNKLMKVYSENAEAIFAADRVLADIDDVDALSKDSEIIKANNFYLKENKKTLSHRLSDEVEAMIAAMNLTAGDSWGSLQKYLTSTVKVDYEGKQISLSEVRNLAYDSDVEVRKKAYEAELASYEKIQDAVAFALNNIKNQVTMLCRKKGYESPLSMTLEQAKMSRATLDAMMEAIEEYLPVFRKYLRKKGELLGHKNGLPFYELFAPLGKSEKKYSIEEAHDYLVKCFSEFSSDLADMMDEAFVNEWIDFLPHNGKRGGAFCAGCGSLKQSRILTNFDGSFGAVDTLAHELGHAYHNRQLENERPLNRDYPYPIAETASTFNEVHLGAYALKYADKDEKLALLESDLKEKTQCIVDIYSRYLFETAVFEQAQEKFLMAADLKELMLDAQKKAYGDGLDENFLHPYMWINKGHYYSDSLSFYNFPYAFGTLYAQGLYSMFVKEGASFVPKYKAMLNATSTQSIEDDGKIMGVDLTKKDFWKQSLQMIADEIEEFLKY